LHPITAQAAVFGRAEDLRPFFTLQATSSETKSPAELFDLNALIFVC
jgi:hypothetical protein